MARSPAWPALDRRSACHFYVVTNADGARNLKVARTAAAGGGAWEDVVPHRHDTVIEEMEVTRPDRPDPLGRAGLCPMHAACMHPRGLS